MADMIKAKKGNHFVLTEYGKTYATYRDCEIGKPIDEDDEFWALERHVRDGVVEEVPDPDWITKEGYSVVYKHNGYELHAGNPIVFPERNLAERYMKHFQNKPWFHDELYIKTETYEGKALKPCREYDGKQVYNKSWYYGTDCLEVGDLVENEIVDDLINALPPTCMRSDCSQCGEPSKEMIDEDGKCRKTYATFKRIANGIWEYCGDCFRGENIQRGTEIPYIA